MKFKLLLIAAFFVLFTSFAFADLGGNPSFYFSISNTATYSDYDFYFTSGFGRALDLQPVKESNYVYWGYAGQVTIYALPKGTEIPTDDSGDPASNADYEADFNAAVNTGLASKTFALAGRNDAFEITSFNPETKLISLKTISAKSDIVSSDFSLIGLALIVIVIIALILAWFFFIKKKKK